MTRKPKLRAVVRPGGFDGQMEELEARILYSADLVGALPDGGMDTAGDTQPAQVVVMPASPAVSQRNDGTHDNASSEAEVESSLELVFIDASVPDADQLVALLQSQNTAGRTLEIHWLDDQSDGVSQIAEVLKGREGIDALHIISHGDAGGLQLGNSRLDGAWLTGHMGELASWGGALSAEADLLLYGCDLASSSEGRALVDNLSLLTGADVAASDDLTGSTLLGGDWTLEYQQGAVEAAVAVGATGQAAWQNLLSITASSATESLVNGTTTGTQENNSDSGKQVAADANGNYVVVWEDATTLDVYGRLYNANGTAASAQFQVNTDTGGTKDQPTVAMDANGNFVVAWRSSAQDGSASGVYAQRYNASGVAQGSEFRVNTYTSSDQFYPAIAMSTTGFVITWTSYLQDGDNYGVYAQRYNASGVAQGSEFQVSTYTNNIQKNSQIGMDSSGNFVIAWQSYAQDGAAYGVFAQRYNASGVAQGSEFQVNVSTTGEQILSDVSMNASGSFVIVWEDSSGTDGTGYGVLARTYNSGGVAQTSEFVVNNFTDSTQRNASVVMGSDGSFVAAWDTLTADGYSYGIAMRQFSLTGSELAPESIVNVTQSGDQSLPSLAWGGDQVIVTWSGNGSGDNLGVFSRRFNTALPAVVTSVGSETRANTTTGDPQQTNKSAGKQVATAANGNYVVVWEDTITDYVYGRLYNASGTALTGEFQVNTDVTGARNKFEPTVAMDDSGNFVIAWRSQLQDGSGEGVYAQRYNASGVAQGSEFRVNTYTSSDQFYPAIAMSATGFVITWTSYGQDGDNYGVYAQRYDASGVAQGSEFRVSTYTTNIQTGSKIGMDDSGNFVIAWSSYGQDGAAYGVYAQRYNASGVAQGSEFRVSVTTSGEQILSDVSMNGSGSFVIAWDDSVADGADYGTFARSYNSSGTALTGEIQLNNYELGIQRYTSVSMSDSGNFVAVFQSALQDGFSNAIALRVFSQTGVEIGAERLVNTTQSGNQNAPSVSWNGAYLVVSWSGNGVGDSEGVFVQRYSSNSISVITSNGGGAAASVNVAENSTAVTTVTATDADGQTLTYSISGGADAARFTIDSSTGVLTFVVAPDYEAPNDSGANNVYDVVVSASDGVDADTQAIAVTVTAVNEAPTATITPTSYSATEQVSLTLHGTGLSMADVDAGGGAVQATFTVTSGILTAAAGTTGVTIGGSGTNTLTLSGTLAQINNLLAGNLSGTLTFLMNSDAPPASVTLSFTASDLGNSGTGGTLTANDTATINITAVNDSPTGSVSISGTVAQNQTLTASNNIADGDGLGTITYQWLRGGVATGTTGTTYALTEADVGAIISVRASYTDAYGTAETVTSSGTAAVANVNDTPTGTVTVSGTATQGQTLTASNNIADIDGLGSITYHWYRGGVDTGSTGTTYVLTEADVGSTIVARATYTDGHGTAETVASSATAAVANVNDAPTGTVSITGTATQGQTLTASNNIADIDGLGTITYHWYRGGVDTGITGSTYVLSEADVGSAMSVQATYTDGHGTNEAVASNPTGSTANLNDAPTGAVTITGTPAQGQTLTASNTIADADGMGTVTYHWLSNGLDTGLTGSTYTLSQADVGAQIRVVATYTDQHGAAEAVSSASSASVANVNDAPTLGSGSMLMSASPSLTVDAATLLSAAADQDGDTLSVQVMSTVTHGQLTVLSDGSLRYEAAFGFSGMDQFTYVAFDGQLQSSVRTVMISVTSPPVDEVIIVNPGTGISTPTKPSTPIDDGAETDTSTPVTPPTIDPIPDPVVVAAPGADQGSGDNPAVDQGDLSDLPPTGAANAGSASALARYATASSFNAGYQGQGFAFRLDLGGMDLGFNAGRAFMASINGMKPVEDASGGLGLNLSLNASSGQGGSNAALLNFTETSDDQLVQVQKVAVQTSGAVVSVGAVWWAARMSGLLASLMISTPAWRSIDPLPVMGLSNGPDGDGEEADDPLAPQGEHQMDEKAAGLFGSQAPSMVSRDLERIG